MRLVVVLVVLLALSPLVLASRSPYSASGVFTAGAPLVGTQDACTNAALQGKTSDCIGVRADARGAPYHLGAHSALPIVDLTACFYNGAALVRCDKADTPGAIQGDAKGWLHGEDVAGIVPPNATRFAVSASAGAAVSWLFMG